MVKSRHFGIMPVWSKVIAPKGSLNKMLTKLNLFISIEDLAAKQGKEVSVTFLEKNVKIYF
jgi:hypothetical protein